MEERTGEIRASAEVTQRAGFAHREELRLGLLTWDRAIAVVSDGIVVVDARPPAFEISDCNPAFESITGYSREEARGQPFLFLVGSDTDEETVQEVRKALTAGSSCKVVLKQYRKDGGDFWSELTLAPARDDASRVTHMVGVLHDITERRMAEAALHRSESQFRTAFELGPAAAAITSLESERFVDVNQSFLRMLGYARDDVIGQTPAEVGMVVDPRDQTRMMKLLIEQGEFRSVRSQICDASGEVRSILVSAAVVQFDNRRHVLSLFSDLSEELRLERELLRISAEERSRLGQDVHDTLGSQFTGIAMLAQALASTAESGRSVPADDLMDLANLAAEGTRRARALARGLKPVGMDEDSLHAALQQLTSDMWTVSRIECELQVDETLPKLSHDVRNQLFYIAQEALNNASKHSRATRIHVRLHLEDDGVVLAVSDNGGGINVEPEEAKGMGLRIMSYRADLIGAELEFNTPNEGGTRVVCRYPLPQENERDQKT